MFTNKHVAKSLENQHLKSTRKYYHSIADINLDLAKVHRSIEQSINKELYTAATSYVNQYISYTTIWNIKFVYNFENPEVVLMQLLHLNYILNNESEDIFLDERHTLLQQEQKFKELKPYKDHQIELRIQKMQQYIVGFS